MAQDVGRQIGDFILGNGTTPGFFGSGQYGVNSQAYALPGFQNFTDQSQQYAQANQGISTEQMYRAATPEEQARQIASRMLGVPSGMVAPSSVAQGTNRVALPPTVSTQPGTDWRAQQGQLAQNLFGTLAGNTPSVAQQQLNQSTQQNIANAYAMAAAGGNRPGAARQAAMNAASINANQAGQGALLRAQEYQNAQGMLGNVLGQARGQDTSGTLGFMDLGLRAAGQQQAGQIAGDQARAQAYSDAAGRTIGGKLFSAAAGAAAGFAGGPGAGRGAAAGAAGGPSAYGGGGAPGPWAGGYGAPSGSYGYGPYSIGPTGITYSAGGMVPGYAFGGDLPSNDTVPAMLSPKEIVLPRSVTLADDAPERAKAFVEAIKAKRKKAA